jgi:anti-sigma factor RsiW
VIRLAMRSKRSLTCQQAVELVTGYLEETLTRSQRRRFEIHVANCPHCPEYLAQMRAVIALAGSITPDDLTARMRSEFISIYRQWRADESPDERT